MAIEATVVERLAVRCGLHVRDVEVLAVPVNDVARVDAVEGRFALKVYHPGRTREQVAWEVGLVRHLAQGGAPVTPPLRGPEGDVVVTAELGRPRCAVAWTWAEGVKPQPGRETYERLGRAAALVHAAADDVAASPAREVYDVDLMVGEQLRRTRPFLVEAGRWEQVLALGRRLADRLSQPGLERGVCHMDLTLDNVLVRDDALTVIDFDSAGVCWRAVEPSGVLRYSSEAFASWLSGYRSLRPFSAADEAAVAVLALVQELKNVAWKLGVADSSSGPPLLTAADLPAVVDDWLDWERHHLPG